MNKIATYFLLTVSMIANAQFINDFSSELQTAGKIYKYLNLNHRIRDYHKNYQEIVLADNFFYRNNYFDLSGNLKWQADGEIPVSIRENVNTYRIYVANKPSNMSNIILFSGFEQQERNKISWVSDYLKADTTDSLGNLHTLYSLPAYHESDQTNFNKFWFGTGYTYKTDNISIIPQFKYVEQNGNDSYWESQLKSDLIFTPDEAFWLKVQYRDDFYWGESGFNTYFEYNDYKINNYLSAGQLYCNTIYNLFANNKLDISYAISSDINLEIKSDFRYYEDKTYNNKISAYNSWILSQSGYSYDKISGYLSFNDKGAYKYYRFGCFGMYWFNSWQNLIDLNLKLSELAYIFCSEIKTDYYFNPLNHAYFNVEYINYLQSSFMLDNNSLKFTIGFQSGI